MSNIFKATRRKLEMKREQRVGARDRFSQTLQNDVLCQSHVTTAINPVALYVSDGEGQLFCTVLLFADVRHLTGC